MKVNAQTKIFPILPEAEIKLEKICIEKLHQMYGKAIPVKVRETVEFELEAIRKTQTGSVILLVRKALAEAGLTAYDIGFRGSAGCSLVLFLCGLTCIDPLNAKIQLYPEFLFGLDGDREPAIDLIIPSEYQEKIIGALRSMDCLSDVLTSKAYVQDENGNLQIQVLDSAKFLIPRGYQASDFTPLLRGIEKEEIPQELINNLPGDCLAKIYLCNSSAIDMLYELVRRTGKSLAKIPLDDKEVFEAICRVRVQNSSISSDSLVTGIPELRSEKIRSIIHETGPENFDQLVKAIGLFHGTGVWEGNAEVLFSQNRIGVDNVIADREDVFEYLLQHGLDRRSAFETADYVRKGKAYNHPNENRWQGMKVAMRSHDIPAWYIESCQKIRYLFPRAHAIRKALEVYWGVWFFMHDNESFELLRDEAVEIAK
jgi:DNA polymerase-3 subunit alpha (Gram-positive type)